jgi:D-beta-D-heptose 7-phosphate kinase/D-beta-D-heptose 1-phosphate adenosyltransferase
MQHPAGPPVPLTDYVARFAEARIWVLGDVMLDEYLVGTVDRISPEAPIQVIRRTGRYTLMGGAANVARSVAALGASVSLVGVIGIDEAGDTLVKSCEEAGVDPGLLIRSEHRPTTTKTRVLGPRQQLLRLDWESTDAFTVEPVLAAIASLAKGAPPTAVILSDYGKGLLTNRVIRELMAAAQQTPVFVDPCGRDASRYRGAFLLKPNLKELENLTGRDLGRASIADIEDAARTLLPVAALKVVMVTLGERGILVVTEDGEGSLVPARSREVYDVTGAGDTVIATLAASISTGAGLLDAARIANYAAEMVVDEIGAAAIEAKDLFQALSRRTTPKPQDMSDLKPRLTSWRRKGKRIVFTNGCFDLLHAGHVWLLSRAAELGDVLIVGLNSDASVRRLKGPGRPLMSEGDRLAMLTALKCVDAAVVFEEDTPLELIERIAPDVLVKGQDYELDDVVGREQVEARNGKVVLVSLLPGHSTSALIERVKSL